VAQKELAMELKRESSSSRRQLSGWQSRGVVVVTGALEVEDANDVEKEVVVHVVLSVEEADEVSELLVRDEDELSVQVVLSAEDVEALEDEDVAVEEVVGITDGGLVVPVG
jgi:hypothetical protein